MICFSLSEISVGDAEPRQIRIFVRCAADTEAPEKKDYSTGCSVVLAVYEFNSRGVLSRFGSRDSRWRADDSCCAGASVSSGTL